MPGDPFSHWPARFHFRPSVLMLAHLSSCHIHRLWGSWDTSARCVWFFIIYFIYSCLLRPRYSFVDSRVCLHSCLHVRTSIYPFALVPTCSTFVSRSPNWPFPLEPVEKRHIAPHVFCPSSSVLRLHESPISSSFLEDYVAVETRIFPSHLSISSRFLCHVVVFLIALFPFRRQGCRVHCSHRPSTASWCACFCDRLLRHETPSYFQIYESSMNLLLVDILPSCSWQIKEC